MPENRIQYCEEEHNFIKSRKTPLLLYCLLCSSIALASEIKTSLSTIKPLSYKPNYEVDHTQTDIFLNEFIIRNFIKKKEYLKVRQKIVQEMRKISFKYHLELQTFFLSVTYLDKICEKINSIKYDEIRSISIFCLILASKFYEKSCVGLIIENDFKTQLSTNYKSDEIYVLQLLDYKLNILTVYDLLQQIKQIGFLFKKENISQKKINVAYSQIDKMAMAFVENKAYIDLTPKQIAFGIIGFLRDNLNLEKFSFGLKILYNFNNQEFADFYQKGYNKIKKCFIILPDTKSKENNKNIKHL